MNFFDIIQYVKSIIIKLINRAFVHTFDVINKNFEKLGVTNENFEKFSDEQKFDFFLH